MQSDGTSLQRHTSPALNDGYVAEFYGATASWGRRNSWVGGTPLHSRNHPGLDTTLCMNPELRSPSPTSLPSSESYSSEMTNSNSKLSFGNGETPLSKIIPTSHEACSADIWSLDQAPIHMPHGLQLVSSPPMPQFPHVSHEPGEV